MRFIDDVLRRLPFRVHVIQTDNGAEFQSHFHWPHGALAGQTPYERLLAKTRGGASPAS
jgi:hypothetical protein